MSKLLKGPAKIDIKAHPTVNFVPSKYADAELDTIVRNRLFYIVNGVWLLCALVYLGVTVNAFSADVFLKNSQLRLEELRTEQKVYSAVLAEESHIKYLENARKVAAGGEVLWKDLIDQVVATYPPKTVTNTITIAPMGTSLLGAAASTPRDALVQVNLFLVMKDYSSIQTWTDRIKTIPGFSDSKISSVSETPQGYEVKLGIYFNKQVLSNRLVPLKIGEVQ